jgi:hypothetical protein
VSREAQGRACLCMVVDWVVAAIIVGEITAGMHFG